MTPNFTLSTTSKTRTFTRSALLTGIALALTVATAGQAAAVGARTKFACAGDYFAFCSMHAVGSSALRQCMRTNGPKLSKRCVNALIADGEVSADEVARRAASLR
jgi:hypothetical protein